MSDAAWGLKAGDEAVIARWNYGSHLYQRAWVAKVTPSGRIKTRCGREFNGDGTERGELILGTRLRRQIMPITPETEDAVSRQEAIATIVGFNAKWKGCATGDLVRIAGVIEEVLRKPVQ